MSDWESFIEISNKLHALSPEARKVAYDNWLRPGGSWDDMLLPPPESPRRPRRDQVVTLRVRIESVKSNARTWRRLALVSGLFLDELHDVL
ncbi:hypothetical protein [Nocardia seriolae]|uniref:Uncharacterized protein n=1 Tax=Nocardia seriolae TaxID=37332 RepID=A0A0B8NMT2_9NOCA|nr:hypothetical protein [Nocardia seriolae]APA97227.1 hypothetical protein NS506_03171 [Nocardia seriolae]MTJ62156.1 hypothetical protein [Nocardia seriolae]MTJ76304.1 hypothetical protein [Nocardia seriolae]MTJ87068.1 hypothetical protein [Nocardia seriolae]MTK31063.1 hypothetical protein [Nocardia seriolae]